MPEHRLYSLVAFCYAFGSNVLESSIAIYVMYHAVNLDLDFLRILLQEEIVLLIQMGGVPPHFNDAAVQYSMAESVVSLQLSGRYSFTGTLAAEELRLLAPKEGRGWTIALS